jgi:DNA-binding CsgD family transcriptional regulator/PAS domain-containing protein
MGKPDRNSALQDPLARGKGRRLVEMERELETILDGLGEGFYSVEHDWRVRRFNREASRHFRRPVATMLGRPLWDAFPQAVPTDLGRQFFKTMARRDSVRSEAQSVTMGPRWLAYRLFPVGQGMGVAFRDITASRTAQLEASLAQAVAAQTAAFDQLAVGIVQLGAGGCVLSANRAARRIDGEADGLSIKGTLRAGFGPDNVRLRAAIAKACVVPLPASPVGDCLCISRSSAGRPYVVFVLPLAAERVLPWLPLAMVLIVDPERQPPTDERTLMRVFDLTPAEARVVALLVTGQGLPAIAKALGIGFETARTHLARARAKTGSTSQVDLVRTVLTTLAPLGLLSL